MGEVASVMRSGVSGEPLEGDCRVIKVRSRSPREGNTFGSLGWSWAYVEWLISHVPWKRPL
jgi:hypothetical protein